MSYVKPLAMATAMAMAMALVLGLTGVNAFAASHDISTATAASRPSAQATYYIADAGTPRAHKVYYFKRLDRNHDGELSRSELPRDMHMLRARFIYADWDDDGKLSPEELIMFKHHTGPAFVGVFHAQLFVFQ